jgi:CHAT domain-containing protein
MKTSNFARLAFILALTISSSANAQSSELTDLNRQVTSLYQSGQYDQAAVAAKKALEITEKALGSDHPHVAPVLNNLATLYQAQGQYAKAEPLFMRSLAINENALGPDHPNVATSLNNSSINLWLLGDMAEAVAALQRSIAIREHHLGLFLVRGSEEEKRAYINTIATDPPTAISLQQAVGPANLAATRLAMTTLLQRKGRILDAISADVASLRERLNEQDRMLLDQLAAIRNQQSSLYNQAQQGKTTPELYHNEAARLTTEAQNLEAKISSHSAEFKTKAQPITLAGIQQAVPKDAALVEFAVYRPFNPKANKWGAARYIAYVLRPQGEPLSIDLGEAADIDRKISELRDALANPSSDSALRLARQLDEQLMRPVRKLLGETRTVFLSPDGALNLLPFGTLVDENNQYLIKHYAFTYLSSGRDLLRLQAKVQSQHPGVIIGDVDFGVAGNPIQTAAVDSGASNRRSSTFVSGVFEPLPGTGMEAREINKILPAAKVLMGKEATEGALKKLNSPRILHVATHGFFLPDLQETPDDLLKSLSLDGAARMPVTENPLLRSGLALANANRLESAGEDGVLTALETSGLNLWGTRLVVLSACETGLGDVQNGEGVFGLRRTLVIAGSESQLMTLWKVDDLATKDLMVDYYRRLVSPPVSD